jgi:hypothetical protein
LTPPPSCPRPSPSPSLRLLARPEPASYLAVSIERAFETTILPKVRWFAAEYLIAVPGVLTAVGINAWWSEREDRHFERKLRADMIAEFEAILATLVSDLAANDSAHAVINSLDTLSDSALLALSSDDLINRFRQGAGVAGFDPEMGFVQALVESGNLGAVGDRDLRLLPSRWAGLLEEKQRYTEQLSLFASQNTFPVRAGTSADLVWTEAERRELQMTYGRHSMLHQFTIEKQRRLQAAALEIHTYLVDQK